MYKCILMLLLFISCGGLAVGQTGGNTANADDQKLKALQALPVSEKVYLHFNRTYYAPGDTIYFAAYLTMGERHVPSTISSVLRVDLIDPSNKIHQSLKLAVANGVTRGDFTLPDSLYSGGYRVRAYTHWMLNNAQQGFFDRIVPVGGTKKLQATAVTQIAKPNEVAFLPEGGTLVAGVSSKVAFKAINKNGLGVDFKGIVLDNNNTQVATISATRLGMGSFSFTPVESRSYKAMLQYADGSKGITDLPEIEATGITMAINNDSVAKASVTVSANQNYYQQNRNKVHSLVIYSGGKATIVKCTLDEPIISLDILKRRLSTGICMVTLFSPDDKPLCERLIFIQNYDQLNIAVKPDKTSYKSKEKVNIDMAVLNRASQPSSGHFSVSIVNEFKFPINELIENNILTDLLLTSDLKGFVEQPDYYFANTSSQAATDLDLVMLTHGYRKFNWEKRLEGQAAPTAYQPEKGINVNGVAKKLGGNPLNKGVVSLLSPLGGLLTQTTDGVGKFSFKDLVFNDTAKFILQAVNSKGKNLTELSYQPQVETPPVVEGHTVMLNDVATDRSLIAYTRETALHNAYLSTIGRLKGKMLQQVNIRSTKIVPLKITSRYGVADQTITAEQIGNKGHLVNKLLFLARGVNFEPSRTEPNVYKAFLRGARMFRMSSKGQSEPMPIKIIVNNMEMDDDFNINTIAPYQIESIDIVRNPLAPAMIFTIAYGVNPRYLTATGILPISVKGFDKAREFYTPKYDHEVDQPNADLRTTIFWKPDLVTDKDGKTSFSYYNADGVGKYRVVVEGMDADGDIGRQVYRYSVQ